MQILGTNLTPFSPKYFLPPNVRDLEYTAESLDCEMHYAGV